METNLIYCFTGTGNSLYFAKQLASTLDNFIVSPMSTKNKTLMKTRYKRIGFIYPTYFLGLPNHVAKFVSSLDYSNNKSTYFFGVTTYGNIIGNGITGLRSLLYSCDIRLHYGASVKSPNNYLLKYQQQFDLDVYNNIFNEQLATIVPDIKIRKVPNIKKANPIISLYHKKSMLDCSLKARHFNVNDDCIGCNICQIVCPVNNVKTTGKKPSFSKKCEQCMACIQFCPQQAINYEDLTNNKGRYHHVKITYKDLKKFYHKTLS